MKILGEKSLSSSVIIGLDVIFAIISLIDFWVFSVILKVAVHISMNENIQSNVTDLVCFVILLMTGIIALFIIYQFLKIFKNLKDNVLFSEDNLIRLSKIAINCFILSALYLVLAIIVFIIMKNATNEIAYYTLAFSVILMFVFMVNGIGIKILCEIYKKAIEYKEENDFTI